MTGFFLMQLFNERYNQNLLNKSNHRFKRAVLNSGVIKTYLKFEGMQRQSATQSINYKDKQ